ncbi:hypothetical protein D5086_020085 [Populus alba]|uniref:Uncharacterized protein n=1 Tax=Populus alba TaxID=43335 RepID=A0ACC4BJQ7_POPAL
MAFPLHESKLPVLPLAMLVFISILSGSLHASDPPLTLDHYASTCPDVFEIVKKEMECEVLSDPRNAALILRLHFHDCFVQVHISLLLALSLIFFNSNILYPKWYPSQLKGYPHHRRKRCSHSGTNTIQHYILASRSGGRMSLYFSPFRLIAMLTDEGLLPIINKFLYQGLSATDMVALSGAHTIGMARCENFRSRIYGDFETTSDRSPMSETYLNSLKSTCPAAGGSGDNNISAMDYATPNLFDNSFYQLLLKGDGLLNSDQELFYGENGKYYKS